MYLIQAFITIAAVGTTLAAPLRSRQSPDPQCIDGQKKIFLPELHDIYIYKDVAAFPSGVTNTVNVMNGGSSGSEQQQVAKWTEIPDTATTCEIGWAVTAERAFSVYDNGLVRFQQMTGLPSDNITVDTIKEFEVPSAKNGSMDFTYWPETPGPRTSIGGPVDCGVEIVVKLYKDMVNGGKGSVTLEQNAQNGLFLAHDC